jgi:2-octaprenylphenol hydroxylase
MGSVYKPDYDVVIVGAGPVGAAAACLLGSANKTADRLNIALIEANPAEQFSADNFDPRVAAVTEKSRLILDRCGVWDSIMAMRVSPYVAMDVWDAESTGRIRFDCSDLQQPNLGHIIESNVMVQALMHRITGLDNVDFICPASIEQCHNEGEVITVELNHDRRISTALLIGADGGRSKVRECFGFECKSWNYDHNAIVATITTAKPNRQTAWQRFMPTGPLALLPLNRQGDLHQSSIVWSQIPQSADSLMKLSDADFCTELSRASEYCLGDVTVCGSSLQFSPHSKSCSGLCFTASCSRWRRCAYHTSTGWPGRQSGFRRYCCA